MFETVIITLSDKGSRGEREDKSKDVIKDILIANGFILKDYILLPDELEVLKNILIDLCDNKNIPLILTTGGTGFSKRDTTPEATKQVIEREAQGIAEAMRYNSLTITKRSMLSRATAGIRKNSLIVNLPGSPKACKENLEYIIKELEHGLMILLDKEHDCADSNEVKL